MKNLGRILSLSLLIVLLSCSFSFASGLKLVDSYPKDGGGGLQPVNVMVKLYFNEDVSAKEVQAENEKAFRITDSKGKEIPHKVLYNAKKLKEIWVLVNQDLTSDSEYKLTISGDLKIPNGDTLGKDETIVFKTRNTKTDNTVNMLLMGLMMVGMIGISSITMKRNLKKEAEKKGEVEKVNPYKVSKETGKSVEEIVAKAEKEKQRVKEKAAANQNNKVHKSGKAKKEEKKDTKKVTAPKPISAAGSTYTTGRKAEAAKAAARAAAKNTNPKGMTGKSRNKNKKK